MQNVKDAKHETFYFVFNRHKLTEGKMYLVEFRFPNAQDNTWVLTHRVSPSVVELGTPTVCRGRKTVIWTRLEETQFNIPGCTGRVKPFDIF